MRHIFCVILALSMFLTPVLHANSFCVEQQAGTLVVFGNGIMNEKTDAEDSRDHLKELLRSTLSGEEFAKLEFDLAYNKSYGFLRDLYESAKQKLGSDNAIISFWRWMGNWDIMPDVLQESASELATRFDFSTQVAPEDLANHVALYRTGILEGDKVLVVSHSQGNFFVNAAYKKLFEEEGAISGSESFGIVAVATPASHVAGSGPYTTLVEDAVIVAIAIATPHGVLPPLPSNITNVFSGAETGDLKGHSFIDEYMATDSRTVEKIMNDVVTLMNSLVTPVPEAQSGIVTVTLTWGDQPDVDLHAYEPNGLHVYYSNRRGVSGYLDVDDVTGYGPEHYYVSCETLEVGTYNVGVNYYRGSSPETALVQISAGSTIRSFSIPLGSAVGSSGDNTPIPVADIVVTGGVEEGYDFSIENRLSTE